MTSATIVWFRQDLRLDDHPALAAAKAAGGPIVPVFVWHPEEEGSWAPASASKWWLHRSLRVLDEQLRQHGSRLIIRRGPAAMVLKCLAKETGANRVFWCRRYEPAVIARDTAVKTALRDSGLRVESFNGSLLVEPWEVKTKQGSPFQVFTPFWKSIALTAGFDPPTGIPRELLSPASWPESDSIESLALEPAIDWAGGMRATWAPGCVEAKTRLNEFLSKTAEDYATERDHPDRDGTSRLSPYLHFGEISPRRIWHEVFAAAKQKSHSVHQPGQGPATFLKELAWREFAHHLLFHFPETTARPLRTQFENFPWVRSEKLLRAWQRGRTGYPIVDAGMRQLWATGWMHNRVRMIVASFLTKDLRIAWQEGAKWFWDTLVDADLANNTLGWQWTAGCGADAAPYFRVFNPMLQGAKFDPDGEYVRIWVPELKKLPNDSLHAPWTASESTLKRANVVLGETYPEPIVDHAEARQQALDAFETIKT